MPTHRMKVEYANFRRFETKKSVTIATSLERSLKEGRFDYAHSYSSAHPFGMLEADAITTSCLLNTTRAVEPVNCEATVSRRC